MAEFEIPSLVLAKINALRRPSDYFGETREGDDLKPHKILCFARKSRSETASEPLARCHHHRYVLLIPCKGEGVIYVDDRQFSLRPGEGLLIFPFQYHHGFNFDRARVLWLFVTFELTGGNSLEALRLDPVRKLGKEELSLIWNLVEAWTVRKKQRELAHWLGLFLVRLIQTKVATPVVNSKGRPPRTSPLLGRINHFCMSNLERPIGLKELAVKLGISESYLRARFRSETGISLGHHLRRLRLQKAMGLLLQSDLSITQIAERCGFESIYAFSRSFRQFTGIMARQYRKRLTQNRKC